MHKDLNIFRDTYGQKDTWPQEDPNRLRKAKTHSESQRQSEAVKYIQIDR